MKGWLLDTNVISEGRRRKPSPAVERWIAGIDLDRMFTTTVNIAEVQLGISQRDPPVDAERIQLWLDNTVRPWFATRTLEIGERQLLRWLLLVMEHKKNQGGIPAVDLLIAAVALEENLGVATRDVTPFVSAGVPTINPWTSERFNGA